MTFKSNITELRSYLKKAPDANKAKINTVIKLYEDKKIVNFKTALNATLLLASTNKNTIKSGRALKEYETVIDKYSNALPITGRVSDKSRNNQSQDRPKKRGRPRKQAPRLEQPRRHEDVDKIK